MISKLVKKYLLCTDILKISKNNRCDMKTDYFLAPSPHSRNNATPSHCLDVEFIGLFVEKNEGGGGSQPMFDKCCHYFSCLKLYLYNQWITYLPIHFFRILYLRKVLGFSIGTDSFIHMRCLFYGGKNKIRIGKNSVIGTGCYLSGEITIGNNVSVTAFSHIQSSSHYKNSPIFEGYSRAITIDDRAWIGVRSYVGPGIHIQEGGILAAQSVLTEEYSTIYCLGRVSSKRNIEKIF
jgi:acetyltransferase-like isoleucine patch superfamily enzyme